MMERGLVSMEWLLVCGFISLLLVMAMRRKRKGKGGREKIPPGPFAWPLIGHLHLFLGVPHRALARLSQRYGPILGLRLGQQRAVVVSSPALARHVLLTLDKLFADRPPLDFVSLVLFGTTNGIIFNRSTTLWRVHRKLCMLHLFTSKRMHDLKFLRRQEIRSLLLSIHDLSSAGSSTPIDLGKCMGRAASRLILQLLLSGTSIEECDENLPQLFKEAEHEARPTVGDLIPPLSCLDLFRKRRMRRLHTRLDKLYTEIIREYKESDSLHEGLVPALLSQKETLTIVQIKSILNDIIGAGIHTTALTVEWAMAELLRNPHCLHRLRSEIDTKLGGRKVVCDADIPSLSYLKCVVKEVFRLHPVIPLLVPRISTEECEVHGYTIPARTLMFVNVWAIGRDESVWPNANEFTPERFEGRDIDLKGQHFELLPFGSGRRICLGLPFALSVVEVTLANLVSCFDWELPNGEAPQSINMEEKRGIAANRATPVIVIPKPRLSRSTLSNM